MIEKIKFWMEGMGYLEQAYMKKILFNIRVTIKWVLLSAVIGVIVGLFSSSFAFCLEKVTACRENSPWLVWMLPLGGLVIAFIYRLSDLYKSKGTNTLLDVIHGKDQEVPVLLAPVIYVTTLITHLFGGSAGREGAALQMGGSLGSTIGRLFRLKEKERKILVLAGMSAAFSAVFGTPLAAAIFPMEMMSVGIMQYSAMVPCVFSSIIANRFAVTMGINPDSFVIRSIPNMSVAVGGKILILGMLCAAVSVAYVLFLRMAALLYNELFHNVYVRIFVGGLLVAGITSLIGNDLYNGAGVGLIRLSISGSVPYGAFLIKMLLTALTLSAGYRGGEIVPAFATGASFGYLYGSLAGISPSLCATVGMISVFCGVTNCPIASLLIGFELFGFSGVPYFMIAVAISYMLSGYRGLYSEQVIMYSKYAPTYINRVSGEETFDGRDYED